MRLPRWFRIRNRFKSDGKTRFHKTPADGSAGVGVSLASAQGVDVTQIVDPLGSGWGVRFFSNIREHPARSAHAVGRPQGIGVICDR
jgi:hypothetical protein